MSSQTVVSRTEGEALLGQSGSPAGEARSRRIRPWLPDLLALGGIVAAAVLFVLPALIRGPYLGPYGFLAEHGLLARPGTVIPVTGNDLVHQMIPWTRLNWLQVHAGHLPLWNPLSGLGMPQAFNWQSAPASLPSLVGYLVPVGAAFSVGVIVSSVVAGTGMYLFARTLGLAPLGAAAGGLFFELSGPLTGWWGYPLGNVMGWAGWIFAGVVIVLRGRRRGAGVALLALSVTFALLAGNPESLLVLAPLVLIFVVVMLVARSRRRTVRSLLRPLLDLVVATVLGAALSAPVVLPSLQLTSGVQRLSRGGGGLPGSFSLVGLVPWRPQAPSLVQTQQLWGNDDVYLGVTVVILAVVGLLLRWRRPPVIALGAIALVTGLVSFNHLISGWAGDLPGLHTVYWSRALMPLAFAVTAVAAVGVDALCRHPDRRRVATGLTVAVAAAAGLVLLTGILDMLGIWPAGGDYRWPLVSLGIGVVAAVLLWRDSGASRRGPTVPETARRREGTPERKLGTWVAASLAACGVLSLLLTNSIAVTSGTTMMPASSAATTLSRLVGTDTVGFGARGCPFTESLVAIPAEANLLYDVHEMAVYDPIIPGSYFTAWKQATGELGGVPALASFCPEITSVATARQFGIGFILEPPGEHGPPGSVFVARIRDESLYRVPGTGAAVLVPGAGPGTWPVDSAVGSVVPVSTPNPSTWVVSTNAGTTSVLRLHLTDVPGWTATIDGRPLALHPWTGLMLQARVPPGPHRIVVTYWPRTLTIGLWLALLGLLGLVAYVIVVRRTRSPETEPTR